MSLTIPAIFSWPSSIIRSSDPLVRAIQRKTESGQTSVSKKTLAKILMRASKSDKALCTVAHEYLKRSQSEVAITIHAILVSDFSKKNISLQGVNLHGAELPNAFLREADLENASLCLADLHDAHLCDAKLNGALLTGANLQGATAYRANLCMANLHSANLVSAALTRSVLVNADLRRCHLRRADLTGANLKGARLAGADLGRAYLGGADLMGADLTGCSLSGADVTNAKLDKANQVYAWLTGATHRHAPSFSSVDLNTTEQRTCLAGIAQFLSNIVENEQYRDIQLNHLNNAGCGLLARIDSIECPALKFSLMQEVVKVLQAASARGVDVSDTYPSLCDVLFRQSLYRNNPTIRSFMHTVLVPRLFTRAQNGGLPWRSPTPALVLESMAALRNMNNCELIKQSAAINELLYAARRYPADDAIHAAATYLRMQWMDVLSQLGLVEAIEAQFLSPETDYVALSDDNKTAIAFDENYMAQICGNASAHSNWRSAYIFARQRETPYWRWRDTALQEGSVANVLQPFPWIQAPYLAQSKNRFLPLLTGIVTSADEEFTAAFSFILEREKTDSVDEKWISPKRQLQLGALFKPCFALGPDRWTLSRDHVNTLRREAEGLGLVDSEQSFARLLLSLATVYTRASSSAFFGTEDDSPLALRRYADGLVRAACSTDKILLDADVEEDWHNRLTGEKKAPECTAILSNMMSEHIRSRKSSDPALHAIFSSIYPRAW